MSDPNETQQSTPSPSNAEPENEVKKPKIALLFPGQGSQAVGMGKAFFDSVPASKAVFDEADEVLGFPLSKLIFEGPEEELRLTENTQPAILTMSVAVFRALEPELKSRGLEVCLAAGHSLGSTRRMWRRGPFRLRMR